jgi:hypothetical protein
MSKRKPTGLITHTDRTFFAQIQEETHNHGQKPKY